MLRSADRHYAATRALGERAVREARKTDFATTVVRHQAAAALMATQGITAMLAEQGTPVAPKAALAPLAFTADPQAVTQIADDIRDQWRLDRLIMSLVADAARSAESVSIATRPRVGYVRYVSPPCCSRCAILAGWFYRWSDGFKRHPGCDCTHLPTTDPRSEFRQNPHDLVGGGMVTDLSKADRRALADGADLNRLVNAKGAVQGARSTLGRSKPSPASIYHAAGDDHDEALRLLAQHGYIT